MLVLSSPSNPLPEESPSLEIPSTTWESSLPSYSLIELLPSARGRPEDLRAASSVAASSSLSPTPSLLERGLRSLCSVSPASSVTSRSSPFSRCPSMTYPRRHEPPRDPTKDAHASFPSNLNSSALESPPAAAPAPQSPTFTPLPTGIAQADRCCPPTTTKLSNAASRRST